MRPSYIHFYIDMKTLKQREHIYSRYIYSIYKRLIDIIGLPRFNYDVYEYMLLSIKFIQFCVPFIQIIHLRRNELFNSACLISARRLFQIRGPE